MPKTIQIRHHAFSLQTPYTIGHTLDQREADALNNLRAENIRNNLAKKMDKLLSGKPVGYILSPSELEGFTLSVREYDQLYSFPFAQPASRPKRGTLEEEVRQVAQEQAERLARAAGKDLTEGQLSQAVLELSSIESIQQEARKRLQARNEVAMDALESLL